MRQLPLFEWAETEAQKTDEGGRCPYCLEFENWVLQLEGDGYVDYVCKTVLSDYDGTLQGVCEAIVTKEYPTWTTSRA